MLAARAGGEPFHLGHWHVEPGAGGVVRQTHRRQLATTHQRGRHLAAHAKTPRRFGQRDMRLIGNKDFVVNHKSSIARIWANWQYWNYREYLTHSNG